MGATVGSDSGGRSVDVELNVVPFIDLMSCLTAFLLVTAVWSQYAQINIKPKGLGRKAAETIIDEPLPNMSILLTKGEIWIGVTLGEQKPIPKSGGGYDWTELETTLKDFRERMPVFSDRTDIEIAAEDDVDYQSIITAMDYAIANKFVDIGFIDPQSLSVRFKE